MDCVKYVDQDLDRQNVQSDFLFTSFAIPRRNFTVACEDVVNVPNLDCTKRVV